MVLLNILQLDAFDDLFTVRDRLVGQDLAPLSLVIHRISEHSLRDLVCLDLSDPLPVQFVRLRQADILSLGASQEHQRLHDLWVAHHSILQEVLYRTQLVFMVEESLGDHLERLVLCFDLTKLVIDYFRRCRSWWLASVLTFLVWIGECLLEVFGVLLALNELEVLDLLKDLLGVDGVVGSSPLCLLLFGLL